MREKCKVIRIDRRRKRRRNELIRKKLDKVITDEEKQELASLDRSLNVGKVEDNRRELLKALLINIRSRNKMTVKEMADGLNIPVQILQDIQNGEEPIPAKMINDFARMKEVNDDELVMIWRLCECEEE